MLKAPFSSYKLAITVTVLALLVRLWSFVFGPGLITSQSSENMEIFPPPNHYYMPPRQDDSRAPCPALNTLANHGYLPRNGRAISQSDFIRSLQEGYNLSFPLAAFITWGGYGLLAQFGHISLDDIRRHGYIEHNASLVHGDAIGDQEYAPNTVRSDLMSELMQDATADGRFDAAAIAKARVRRESTYATPIDPVHAEIARGEMAIALGVFGGENGTVPAETLRYWLENESFPPEWKPFHRQTLWQTIETSGKIRGTMKSIRAAGQKKA